MTEFKPLMISVILIFILGAFIPYLMSPFVENDEVVSGSYVEPVVDIINNGVSLPVVSDVVGVGKRFWNFLAPSSLEFQSTSGSVNLISVFPDSVRSFLVKQLTAFSYIPTVISAPLLIFCAIAFVYSFLKLIRG